MQKVAYIEDIVFMNKQNIPWSEVETYVTANLDCHEKDTHVCNFLLSALSINNRGYIVEKPTLQKRRLFCF